MYLGWRQRSYAWGKKRDLIATMNDITSKQGNIFFADEDGARRKTGKTRQRKPAARQSHRERGEGTCLRPFP